MNLYIKFPTKPDLLIFPLASNEITVLWTNLIGRVYTEKFWLKVLHPTNAALSVHSNRGRLIGLSRQNGCNYGAYIENGAVSLDKEVGNGSGPKRRCFRGFQVVFSQLFSDLISSSQSGRNSSSVYKREPQLDPNGNCNSLAHIYKGCDDFYKVEGDFNFCIEVWNTKIAENRTKQILNGYEMKTMKMNWIQFSSSISGSVNDSGSNSRLHTKMKWYSRNTSA